MKSLKIAIECDSFHIEIFGAEVLERIHYMR